MTTALAASAGAVGLAMFALWLLSLRLRDASIVDPWWAPGMALATGVAFAVSGQTGPRSILVLALVCAWGARLGGYLLRRKWGEPEDFRYAAMRAKRGQRFGLWSLGAVFGFQGLLQWLLSLPLQWAVTSTAPLGWLDGVAGLTCIVGLTCEAVADAQLARFKGDPASRGEVMDRGLWRYSRHPNYFGDALMWWGFGLYAVSVGAWPLLYAPAMMTFLLLRVSGVRLLEKDIGERRPAYADYIRRTSAFIPWFPKPPGAP